MKTYVPFILVFALVFSCKTELEKEKYNLDLIEAKYQKKPAKDESAALAILEKKLESSQATAQKNDARSNAIDTLYQGMNAGVQATYFGKAKTDLMDRLKSIKGQQEATDSAISAIRASYNSVEGFMNPLRLDAIRDSLRRNKLDAFKAAHPNRKMSSREADKLSREAAEEFVAIIEQQMSYVMQKDEELRVLLITQHTIALEFREIESNLRLQQRVWAIMNGSYFETGDYTLTREGRGIVLEEVGASLDTFFAEIKGIMALLQPDTAHYNAKLNIYVDGYSDSQPFDTKSGAENQKKNKELSQKRAETILNMVVMIFYDRLKTAKFKNLTFTPPMKAATGHGIKLPEERSDYRANGQADENRRVALMQFTFSIDPTR